MENVTNKNSYVLILSLALLLIVVLSIMDKTHAQVPQGMNYQAIARN